MGLDEDAEVQQQIRALMKEVTERALIEALVKQEILDKVEVTEKEAKAYYDEHREEFEEKEKVKIRQIMVATEEDAQKVRQELEEGADFAELAKEKSTDPHAKERGGDMGYVERGKMLAELPLQDTVGVACPLFLSELQTPIRYLSPLRPLPTGRQVAPLYSALLGGATLTL